MLPRNSFGTMKLTSLWVHEIKKPFTLEGQRSLPGPVLPKTNGLSFACKVSPRREGREGLLDHYRLQWNFDEVHASYSCIDVCWDHDLSKD